jgi:2-succinyl-6-hydroxy-2,4-cyclohexadiene-1-carboxylate synthase
MIVRLREGVGARVLLLHGMLGAPSMWRETVSLARTPATIDALLLPGHGKDPWGVELSSFDAVVAAIEHSALTEPTAVVGYSLGGRLALALAARGISALRGVAARDGLALRGVAAIGASAGLATDHERVARRAWEQSMIDRLVRGGVAELVAAWEELPIFATQRELDAEARDAQRRARTDHTTRGLSWAFSALGTSAMPDLRAALVDAFGSSDRPIAPLVLVTGERDRDVRSKSDALASMLGVRHAIVPGAGHNVALEAPLATAHFLDAFVDECFSNRGNP